jgi:hypothetical protein
MKMRSLAKGVLFGLILIWTPPAVTDRPATVQQVEESAFYQQHEIEALTKVGSLGPVLSLRDITQIEKHVSELSFKSPSVVAGRRSPHGLLCCAA